MLTPYVSPVGHRWTGHGLGYRRLPVRCLWPLRLAPAGPSRARGPFGPVSARVARASGTAFGRSRCNQATSPAAFRNVTVRGP